MRILEEDRIIYNNCLYVIISLYIRDNYDDGETKALILCNCCGNLRGECDRVLHHYKHTDNLTNVSDDDLHVYSDVQRRK